MCACFLFLNLEKTLLRTSVGLGDGFDMFHGDIPESWIQADRQVDRQGDRETGR